MSPVNTGNIGASLQVALVQILDENPPGDEKTCRSLGDAIFAFFAPADAAILTTNERDHRPLAAALGKSVDTP